MPHPHGRLAVIPRPRGGDWLDIDLQRLRRAGVDVLVSMLTPDEERELVLLDEPQRARAAGLDYVAIATPDRATPSPKEATPALQILDGHLRVGRCVVVHCRMGIGRSTMVAAALLVMAGAHADDAWRAVAESRGRPVPDTDEQRDWVRALARRS